MIKSITAVVSVVVGALVAFSVIEPSQAEAINQAVEVTVTQVAGASAALVGLFVLIRDMFKKDK